MEENEKRRQEVCTESITKFLIVPEYTAEASISVNMATVYSTMFPHDFSKGLNLKLCMRRTVLAAQCLCIFYLKNVVW